MLPPRAQIILGPPGTGKTTTLLGLMEKELEQGTEPDRIGFFTFTRRAAQEGKDRAMARFTITNRDLPYFRTLHSLAFQQLGLSRSSVLGSTGIAELNERLNLSLSLYGSSDTDLMGLASDDRLLFIENLARIREVSLKDQWLDVEDVVNWFELERFARGLELFKQERLLRDYTDMLTDFLQEGVAPSLDAMFVDEAQDLSPLQWSVVRKLCENAARIYLAGDDDQAIYRWAGADVDYLIRNSKNAMILKQSYRVPQSIHRIAHRCISQVSSRIHKEWLPRKEEGEVAWIPDVDAVDMEEGDWLVLARTNYLLERLKDYCKSEGWFFQINHQNSIAIEKVHAVRNWERLRNEQLVSVSDALTILKYIRKLKVPDLLVNLDEQEDISLAQLRGYVPELGDAVWYDTFTAINLNEISYIRAMLRRGEKITKTPRIRLSTIHSAKGGEATNVLLLTDLSSRVYDSYQRNPDDESRVFYVATTRAKEKLVLVEPQTPKHYLL